MYHILKWLGVVISPTLTGHDWEVPCDTHHYWIIVSTSHSENHSGSFISDPAGRHHHLTLIPHPACEVSQCWVLCDVVVAGRNWHVDHRASLEETKCQWKDNIWLIIDSNNYVFLGRELWILWLVRTLVILLPCRVVLCHFDYLWIPLQVACLNTWNSFSPTHMPHLCPFLASTRWQQWQDCQAKMETARAPEGLYSL